MRATFGGLQDLGYDLNRVASGFADESSDQLPANTARLWSLGKADPVVNTDKKRANTFGFLAIQGLDYYQASANSFAESLIGIFPKIRALHSGYIANLFLDIYISLLDCVSSVCVFTGRLCLPDLQRSLKTQTEDAQGRFFLSSE